VYGIGLLLASKIWDWWEKDWTDFGEDVKDFFDDNLLQPIREYWTGSRRQMIRELKTVMLRAGRRTVTTSQLPRVNMFKLS